MTKPVKYRLCYKPAHLPVRCFEYEAMDYLDAVYHGKHCCDVLESEFYSVEQVIERKGKPNEQH